MKAYKNSQKGKSYFLFILIAAVAIGSGILVQSSKKPPAELPEFKKIILLLNNWLHNNQLALRLFFDIFYYKNFTRANVNTKILTSLND